MMAVVEIAVDVRETGWRGVTPDPDGFCTKIARETLEALNESNCELSIVLADDRFIQDLNREFRGKDTPTDVLSFGSDEDDRMPGADTPKILGDIVIAYGEAYRELPRSLAAHPEHHLAHLIVHGILHLLGYDHEQESEAEIMEGLEAQLLQRWGIGNPYAEAGADLAPAGDVTK